MDKPYALHFLLFEGLEVRWKEAEFTSSNFPSCLVSHSVVVIGVSGSTPS